MNLFKKTLLKVKPKHLIWFDRNNVINLIISIKYDVRKNATQDGCYFLVAKKDGKNILLLLVDFGMFKKAIDEDGLPEDYSYPVFYLETKNGYIRKSIYLTWYQL